jgi:TetR/AcrR family acrAB operon transcriptional repressor
MARKTKEEVERTFQILLGSAAELFLRQGIAKTTLNEIAEHAGMTRGAIYWHFENKDDVIRALWERNTDALFDSFILDVESLDEANPSKHFRQLLLDMITRVIREPEVGQAVRISMHNIEFTEEQTELHAFLREKRDRFFDAIVYALNLLREKDLLVSGLDPTVLAHAVISYLYGLIHSHLEPGGYKGFLEINAEELVDLLLSSILRPGNGQ